MTDSSSQESSFILEEIFQLLRESLEFDPFNQSNYRPTKKHLIRFRCLLGQEYSFWLAETGNLFFSVLICAKTHADHLFGLNNNEAKLAKKCYGLLLHLSQLIMSVGLSSEKTITTTLKLNALVADQRALTGDIYSVIDATLCKLQKQICNQITVKKSFSI